MSKNDDAIKALLTKVENQTKALGQKPKAVLVTNGVFKSEGGSAFNLNTINDKGAIVALMASLLRESYFSDLACEKLGLPAEYEKDGFSFKDWETDLKYRLSVIEWNQKNSSLEKTRQKLNSLMSEDVKTELELEKIMATLG